MRYAQLRSMDISNGPGIGVSLFLQGCHFHCPECFNQETWNFNGGKEWTADTEQQLFQLLSRPYVTRFSILGGEPLADENMGTADGEEGLLTLITHVRETYPDIQIWLYTGYQWEEIMKPTTDFKATTRRSIVLMVNVVVDGRFETDKKDLSLCYKGSSNQRIIDVRKSVDSAPSWFALTNGNAEPILWQLNEVKNK